MTFEIKVCADKGLVSLLGIFLLKVLDGWHSGP
jgi:hypothetical protein